ncbi:MAG: hypothetical protein ACRCUI_06945 [Polymorphobacter sp.]
MLPFGPIGLAQLLFQDLAAGVARQFVDETDGFGDFVGGGAREDDELARRRVGSFGADDVGLDAVVDIQIAILVEVAGGVAAKWADIAASLAYLVIGKGPGSSNIRSARRNIAVIVKRLRRRSLAARASPRTLE